MESGSGRREAGEGVTPLPAAASALASTALKYAAYGWSVFPLWPPSADGSCACMKGALCERSGKHPLARLAPNGLLDATRDDAIISGWWAQYPYANIAGTRLATVTGSLRTILTGERTALNVLGRLCGVATATRRY